MDVMIFLTDFADQAVVLPIVAAIAILLAARGWWRGALTWLGVIAVSFGVVLVLKVGFLACGPVFGPWTLRSPSGHTAAASVLAGGLVALMSGRRWAVLLAASLAAAVIGTSRLALSVHSVPEVCIGAVAGVAGAWALCVLAGPPPPRRPVSLLAVGVVLAMLLHGLRLPAEAAIGRASTGALNFVPACRVTAS